MELDVANQSLQEVYLRMVQMITPRPIAWVSTLSIDGIPNLAPFSFFTGIGAKPPTVCFSPANDSQGRPKDTLENIRRTGQFVVNVVTLPLAAAMHRTADDVPPESDEFQLAGLEQAASVKVAPPRVKLAAAAMECTLHSAIQLGTGPGGANLVIGNVVYFHIDDTVADQAAIATIGRVGRRDYTEVNDTFRLQ
ncbi:flavin reductase family protein [Stieleria sp. TO1_6]|uniref:flavin reductase family protein n=1 Tax=Stieleria tagensis TaxID=2956795 RepID=UPI00209B6D9E|nr:flavin reductase family protein [Stieleria tagensis]MCO8124609.1 flavin reductase family protein [Stieleria tagensis]